jgi:hypothetical protein
MTRQITTGVGVCGFRGRNPVRKFRYLKALPVALISVIVFGLQSRALAQGNLVDLYGWANETEVGYDPNPSDYVNVSSSNSANFYGDLSPNGFAVPIVSGSLDTIPGAAYEISFTLQNNFITFSDAQLYFGNTLTDIDLPSEGSGNPANMSPIPVSIDFTAMATSSTTPMSFEFGLDSSGDDSLYNFQVMEVPETSSAKLFALGLVLLFAWKSRRLLQTPARKLAAVR